MSGDVVIEREIFIAAAPETVFQFFIDPALMIRWIGQQHALDPRPSGVFRVALSGGAVASGSYKEISPYRRIAFTWGWEGRDDLPPGRSLVEVELEPREGGTLLRLRHSGISQEVRTPFTPQEHGKRWTHYLGKLAEQCTLLDGGPHACNAGA
jgi:uncharacterized protein YndB with AHSA1/START domain